MMFDKAKTLKNKQFMYLKEEKSHIVYSETDLSVVMD